MAITGSIADDKGSTSPAVTVTGGANARHMMGVENNTFDDSYIERGNTNNSLVTETGTPGLSVDVPAGVVYVPRTSYTETGSDQKLIESVQDASETLAVSANGTGSTRYDWVVRDFDTSATSNDTGSNLVTNLVVEGTAGAGLPALGNDRTPLALITMTSGLNPITDSDITDVRKFGPNTGWMEAPHTFTYVSASDPSFVMEVASNENALNYYEVGMKVRLWQLTGGWKYFFVTKVAVSSGDTELTLYGGTDYNLESEAIYFVQVSRAKAPKGFPLSSTKWDLEVRDTSFASQTSPTSGTWYNAGSVSIDLPIGEWTLGYKAKLFGREGDGQNDIVDVYGTLSTANNTESDDEFTQAVEMAVENASGGTSDMRASLVAQVSKNVSITTPTTYYLNISTNQTGQQDISLQGNAVATRIFARFNYL
jgi:hypothetical protein